LASHAGVGTWDSRTWFAICDRQLQLFRDAGELSMLPFALNGRICTYMYTGELAQAVSLLDELRTVTDATGIPAPPYGPIAVHALHGDEAAALAAVDTNLGELVARGEGIGVSLACWGLGMLYNGLGRYQEAVEATRRALDDRRPLGVASWAGMELI